MSNPSVVTSTAERQAHQKWITLAIAEASFLRQKSRVTWHREGDMNSAFFHHVASTRRLINQIYFLLDQIGNKIERKSELHAHCVGFFSDLLKEKDNSITTVDTLRGLIHFRCSDISKRDLLHMPQAAEMKDTMFSLPRNKAPGPDGFPVEFFIGCWDFVGRDVCESVLEFFNSGQILKQWNSTILSLVPKTVGATKIVDFRPIACCNTLYKVVSKLLAKRLKRSLPGIISRVQSAFIPGRLLVENVLLATELVKGFNWKSITPRGMFKVDLRKAFDTVRWSFVVQILKAMYFPQPFVNLIWQCVSTPFFSISINGEISTPFKGERSLRKGDPISPYLFVLVLEVLSQLLKTKFSSGHIGHHPSSSNPSITHLAFGNDLMIFSMAAPLHCNTSRQRSLSLLPDLVYLWTKRKQSFSLPA